jgi:thiol-disulfide isomerase/thioredoxin
MSNNPSRKLSRHQQAMREHERPTPNRTPLFVALGVAAVIVVAVVAGVVASNSGDDEGAGGGSATSEFAEIIGDPLPEPPRDGGPDPAVGTPAPDLVASTFDGEQVTVAGDSGPKMIAFLAHWCPHCQRELPVVVDWLADGGLPDGVELVAVSTAVDDRQDNYPPQDWFADEGFTGLVLADNPASALGAGYGVNGFPFWAVVDGDGNIVLRTSGEKTPAELDAMAAAALS